MNLNDELKSALRRQDAPSGFAGRVQQRVAAPHVPFWGRPLWMWPTIATAMIALTLAGSMEYRRIQGERASRQAILALRIASEKLNNARSRVLKLNTEN